MNRKTACITDEQFNRIITILYNGEKDIKPNKEMALILTVTGNSGLRIGDCLQLKLNSFIREGNDYRFNIYEEKTGKQRTTLIPGEIYEMIKSYALMMDRTDKKVFKYTVRSIQLKLREICEYLGDDYADVSTHSFRKHAGMTIYRLSGNDIELTRKFLNHSSVNVTQKYLGVNEEEINDLLKNHYSIPFKTA